MSFLIVFGLSLKAILCPAAEPEKQPDADAPPSEPSSVAPVQHPTDTNTEVADANTDAADTDIGDVDTDIGDVDTDIGGVDTDIGGVDADIGDVDAPLTDHAYSTVVSADRLPPLNTTTHIDRDEITLRGGRTLPDVFETEPAVEVNHSPKAGAELQLRGFDEKSIRLMFEGIPIVEVYDGHFDITAMPVFALSSITIDKGVVSPLFGPNTTGGVVRLNAPSACGETMDTGIYGRASGDKSSMFGGRSTFCLSHRNVTVFFGAGYEHSEGHSLSRSYEETPENSAYHEDGDIRDGSDYKRASLTLLTRYAPARNKELTLFVDGVHAPRGIPPFEGSGFTRYWRFTRYDTFLVGLTGELGPETAPATFGFKGVRAHLHTHVHRDGLSDYTDATYTQLTQNPNAWFVKSAYANESYGAELSGSWALNRGNTVELVLRYTLDRHRQRDMPVPEENEDAFWDAWERYLSHTYSAAVEDTQVIGDVRLNAGVGVNGMSLLAEETNGEEQPVDTRVIPGIEGRLAAEWKVTEGVRITAAVGHKVRFPMLKELFANVVGGNPDLDAEKTWTGELGLESHDLVIDGLDVSLGIFGSRISDLINKTQDAFVNIGRSVIAGVEVDVQYMPIRLLQFRGGYRYLFTQDLNEETRLNYRTPHRGVLGARLILDFGLTVGIEGILNSGQQGDSVDVTTGKWVTAHLSPYALLNAHIRYEPNFALLRGGYIYTDGFNLVDTDYAVGSFEPRSGREIIIGFGSRF